MRGWSLVAWFLAWALFGASTGIGLSAIMWDDVWTGVMAVIAIAIVGCCIAELEARKGYGRESA